MKDASLGNVPAISDGWLMGSSKCVTYSSMMGKAPLNVNSKRGAPTAPTCTLHGNLVISFSTRGTVSFSVFKFARDAMNAVGKVQRTRRAKVSPIEMSFPTFLCRSVRPTFRSKILSENEKDGMIRTLEDRSK